MAKTFGPVIDPKNFKTSFLNQRPNSVRYDKHFDCLRVYFDNPRQRSAVFYLDDYVGILVSPETMEIIGLHIEAFTKAFVHKHSSLENVWKFQDNCQELQIENAGDFMFYAYQKQQEVAKEVWGIAKPMLLDKNNRLQATYA